MTILAAILTVLACLPAVVWITRHLLLTSECRHGFALTADSPGPPADPPRVSVVVAAKDEQIAIEPCIRSLLDQDYPNYELIACDDRSTDRTPEILARIAAENPRLRLMKVERLPEGWCGKNNAMQTAIAQSDGEWIVMIDADARQVSRRTLSVAVQCATDMGADIFSILPTLEMKGFWENVIQPVCGGVLMIWFNPQKVNSPRHQNAYANGAFMMIRRSAYNAIGTHEAVRMSLNEDMDMARMVKERGLNVRVVRAMGLYICRMYYGCRSTMRGWSRIFYGTFGTLKRLTISLVVMAVMGWLPYVAAALGLSLAWTGAAPAGWWLACGLVGLAGVALQLSVIYRFYKMVGTPRWVTWTYPLGCLMAMIVLVQSLSRLKRGSKVTWRGTTYKRK
ncbi:MAG: glycosyltransferase family 2 protein [Phycisphaerae bacterium]